MSPITGTSIPGTATPGLSPKPDAATGGSQGYAVLGEHGELLSAVGGEANISVGTGACGAITTAKDCIGVGAQTLASNLASSYNIAIGDTTFNKLTGGQSNIGIGVEVAPKATKAEYITAVGENALLQLSEGHDLIAFGVSALETLVKGEHIIAIGGNAMSTFGENREGINWNCAVGESAGSKLKIGEQNTFIGHGAAEGSAELHGCVAVGWQAMRTATGVGVEANVAIGANTLYETKSSGNVALGDGAGRHSVEGFSNVFIGRNAGPTALGEKKNVSHKIWIHPGAETDEPLIYGDTAEKELQINGKFACNGAVPQAKHAKPTTVEQVAAILAAFGLSE